MFEADDDDFMPSSSSNLSSIFNASLLSDDSSNLSYKAPKQPKPSGNPNVASSEQIVENKGPSSQLQSSVVLAKVITLWKLESGQNKLFGKHIVAIIGNTGQQLFEIIVYQEKTNILIRQPLKESLVLYKYPKNFIGIFDSNKQFWNLSFDSQENQDSFLKEITAHKCQIIEQKSQNNASDQVDNRTENLSVSKDDSASVDSKKADHLINDRIQNEDNDSKSRILSRITKMGKQILPPPQVQRKTSTELSDSETESSHSDPKPLKPATVPRKFRRNPSHEKTIITTPVAEHNIVHSTYSPNASPMFSNNNQMVLNPHSMVYSQPYPDYGVNNFIMAQNAELKANLAEINLKLSSVLTQSGTVDKNGNREECDILRSKIKCLNLKIENLTSDLERSNQRFEDLKKKYNMQCSEMIEEQVKLEQWQNLPKEVNRLKEEINNLEALREKNEKLNMNLKEKDKLIETQRLDLENAGALLRENEHSKDNLSKEIIALNSKIEELTLMNEEYEEKLRQQETVSAKIQKEGSVVDKDIFSKRIKETMNEAFRGIMEQFEENDQYNFKDIQRVVLENLKKTTYSLINAID